MKEITGSQDYYWTPEWQEGEKEADKDITTANYVTFSSASSVEDICGT